MKMRLRVSIFTVCALLGSVLIFATPSLSTAASKTTEENIRQQGIKAALAAQHAAERVDVCKTNACFITWTRIVNKDLLEVATDESKLAYDATTETCKTVIDEASETTREIAYTYTELTIAIIGHNSLALKTVENKFATLKTQELRVLTREYAAHCRSTGA